MTWWTRLLGRDEAKERGLTARAVHFDTEGWESVKARGDVLEWRDTLGNTLQVRFHAGPAEHLGDLPDIGSVRTFCRQKADTGGGAIISVETVEIAGIRCLKSIDKYERPPTYVYEGAITIPQAGSHFSIVANATEHGVTGMREAVVTAHLARRGELDLSRLKASGREGQPIPGWFRDPYDPGYEGRTLHSVSDDTRFDTLFPDHPLSRVRSCLAQVQRSVRLDAVMPMAAASLPIDDGAGEFAGASLVPAEAIASLYLEMGHYEQAAKMIADAVGQTEGRSVADPVGVGRQTSLLGFAYERQGKFADAEAAFRKASANFEAALGSDHPNTAEAINNLGRALIAQGQHEAAEPLFRRALRVFENAEESGSNAGVALNGLGLVYNASGRYAEAIPCFERALLIIERVHGPSFPDVATVLRNMAFSWKRLGKMERMVDAWKRADQVDSEQRTR